MPHVRFQRSGYRPTLSFSCLLVLLIVLWLAGGASREDAGGQAIVRISAAGLSIITLMFASRGGIASGIERGRPIILFLIAALGLALVQLVPLPPALWQSLPGRAFLAEAAAASGQAQPWRPWSVSPGATVNALASLIVPVAVVLLTLGSRRSEQRMLPTILLIFISAMTLVGLLQFSGAGFSDPLVNSAPTEVSGTFANRNHFALLLAIGCLLTPIWAFATDVRSRSRGPIAIGLSMVFLLSILATGSRVGLVLGVTGLALSIVCVHEAVRRLFHSLSRKKMIIGAAVLIVLFVMVLLASVLAGRAVSLDRITGLDLDRDMRRQALSTVLSMVGNYFPFGSGLGGFDPLFRIHEPFALLAPTYFNHAHDDWIEIVLDAGLLGALLLLTGLVWWCRAGLSAWRERHSSLRRLGFSVLLLVFVASAFDYPARTPIFMAIVVFAGLWLCEDRQRQAPALPENGRDL